MEYRSLNVTVISAEAIKNVKLFSKMNVYAVVELQGYPLSKKKTFVDKDCGTHPEWNHRMEFVIDEPYVTIPALSLVFTLMAETSIGCDRVIGSVVVPVHDLYNNNPDNSAPGEEKNVEYQICTPKNRARGTLKLSYHFGEKFTQQIMDNKNQVNQTVSPFQFTAGTVYPPSASPPPQPLPPHDPGTAYPPLSPPPVHAPYPPAGGYGYSPPPGYLQSTLPGYSPAMSSGYSNPTPPVHGQAPPPGYGYQSLPPGYGYQAPAAGYGYQAQPPQGYGYQAPPQGYGYQASPQAYAASTSTSSTSKKTKKNKRKGEDK